MSSNEDDDDDIIKILMYSNGYDEETMNQKKKIIIIIIKKIKWLLRWNNRQIKIIWRSNKIDKKSKRSRWFWSCQRFW